MVARRKRNTSPDSKKKVSNPGKGVAKIGKGSSGKTDGDYVEMSIGITICRNYNSASARTTWKTSDPDLIPHHGDDAETINDRVINIFEILSEPVSKMSGDLSEAVDSLNQS